MSSQSPCWLCARSTPARSRSPIFVLGDFNHCCLESTLPGFYQYVERGTRNYKILEKCYGNGAFKIKALPHPSLTPITWRSISCPHINQCSNPASPSTSQCCSGLRTAWSPWEDALSADWCTCHLNKATDTITEYIKFCINCVVLKKDVILYPNNKPYITTEVKACIKRETCLQK